MRRPTLPARIGGVRLAALLLALLPFGALGLAAFAAEGPVARSAEEPAYPHGSFQGDCSECHGDEGWKPARISRKFDHAKRTGFPLTGAHTSVKCQACHTTLDFTQPRKLCSSCHQDPHLGEFGPDCARCHTPRSFLDRAGMVRMHQMTRFPLAGAHAGLDCESCHPLAAQGHLRFATTDADCYSCHRTAFAGTTNPAHVALGFPTDCVTCHTSLAWRPARFDHAGATECYSCHRSDYDRTSAPAHVAAGFPTACVTCHTARGWQPSTFDHAATAFALTGAHLPAPCANCHGDPWQNTLASDCYSCHRPAYDATAAPAHGAGGIPTTCTSCHNTVAWQPATFDHAATAFPLTGAHVQTPCADCHGSPWRTTLASDCYSCHQPAYDATLDPAHAAAGFPTACATCHNTSTWSGATFDHSWFPIASGRHSGNTCSTCHVVPTNYASFSCLNGCHSQSNTDGHHSGVSGYRYDSAACYSCHPRGAAG